MGKPKAAPKPQAAPKAAPKAKAAPKRTKYEIEVIVGGVGATWVVSRSWTLKHLLQKMDLPLLPATQLQGTPL